jgi:hypothetical protein
MNGLSSVVVYLWGGYSWLFFAIAPVVWAFRVYLLGLWRKYPALLIFLVYVALNPVVRQIISLSLFSESSQQLYRWFYFVGQPLWWLLSFLVVLDIYQRMLAGYRGFQRLGELAKYGALGTVALVVSVLIAADSAGNGPGTLAVRAILVQQRGVYISLTVLCLLLASFAVVFHLSIPKNVQHVFGVFGIMFAGFAVLETLRAHLGNEVAQFHAVAGAVLHIGCMLTGAYLFSRAGEEVDAPVFGHSVLALDTGTEAVLVGRLEGFNQLLLKVLRS